MFGQKITQPGEVSNTLSESASPSAASAYTTPRPASGSGSGSGNGASSASTLSNLSAAMNNATPGANTSQQHALDGSESLVRSENVQPDPHGRVRDHEPVGA